MHDHNYYNNVEVPRLKPSKCICQRSKASRQIKIYSISSFPVLHNGQKSNVTNHISLKAEKIASSFKKKGTGRNMFTLKQVLMHHDGLCFHTVFIFLA